MTHIMPPCQRRHPFAQRHHRRMSTTMHLGGMLVAHPIVAKFSEVSLPSAGQARRGTVSFRVFKSPQNARCRSAAHLACLHSRAGRLPVLVRAALPLIPSMPHSRCIVGGCNGQQGLPKASPFIRSLVSLISLCNGQDRQHVQFVHSATSADLRRHCLVEHTTETAIDFNRFAPPASALARIIVRITLIAAHLMFFK